MLWKAAKVDRKNTPNAIIWKKAFSVILANLIIVTLGVMECGEVVNITVILCTFLNDILVG